jgi:hypothetical protein
MRWSSHRSWPGLLRLAAFAVLTSAGTLLAQGPAGPTTSPAPGDPGDLYNSLRDVINYGAELFNKHADHAGCYRVYQGALVSVRPLLAPEVRKRVEDSLARAETMPVYSDRAFELRRALDEVRSQSKAAVTRINPAVTAPPAGPGVGVTLPKVEVPAAPPKATLPAAQKPADLPRVDLPKITESPAQPPVSLPPVEGKKAAEVSPPVGLPPLSPPTGQKVEVPKADPPKVEDKKADAPRIDLPPIDPPPAGLPKVEPKKAETPKMDPPKVDLPLPLPADPLSPVAPPVAPPPEKKGEAPKTDLPKVDEKKPQSPPSALPPDPLPPLVSLPKVDPPKVELPQIDPPAVGLPKVDLPTVDIAKPDGKNGGKAGEVSGKVTFDGKPLAPGYFVTLVAGEKRFSTPVQKEGNFAFTKPVPSGIYRVVFEPIPGEKAMPIPDRYFKEGTSGLTVEVSGGPVMPELRLTK